MTNIASDLGYSSYVQAINQNNPINTYEERTIDGFFLKLLTTFKGV